MMAAYYNPALSQEPRNQSIKTIPPIRGESLLNWLENSGRFHSSEIDEFQNHKLSEDLDDILEPDGYALDNEEEQQD
ncbi:MAG: DUF3134 family protein [Leptolyngbyaceae cyanobacterium SL_7_1]|nr:DUF3134 family protein [Leptolyngbyaceae cyanobacterium SL_7_1]